MSRFAGAVTRRACIMCAIGSVLTLGLAASAHAQPVDRVDSLFQAACLNGSARLAPGEAAAVGFDQLPAPVRSQFRAPRTAKVWHLRSSGQTYLYLFENEEGSRFCGVASDRVDRRALTEALDLQLAGSVAGSPRLSMQWLRPEDGYIVTLTGAGAFTVSQIEWLNDEDRRRASAEVRDVQR